MDPMPVNNEANLESPKADCILLQILSVILVHSVFLVLCAKLEKATFVSALSMTERRLLYQVAINIKFSLTPPSRQCIYEETRGMVPVELTDTLPATSILWCLFWGFSLRITELMLNLSTHTFLREETQTQRDHSWPDGSFGRYGSNCLLVQGLATQTVEVDLVRTVWAMKLDLQKECWSQTRHMTTCACHAVVTVLLVRRNRRRF